MRREISEKRLAYMGNPNVEHGTCPVCERTDVTVTKKGEMRWHCGDIWVAGHRQMCQGTGKPPRTEKADA